MKPALRLCIGSLLASAALSGCGGASEVDHLGSADGTAKAPSPYKDSLASTSPGAPAVPAAMPRKIIYTAEVDLVSEDITGANKRLAQDVRENHGYVASREVSGKEGEQRRATWKLRVPVDDFDRFLAEVQQLGEVQRVHSDSQDVSDEYYDLAARLSNKRVEEQRLLTHLRISTASLKDILSVEKEVSRVRGEIEELQGKLQLMANQTALTTVTVTLSEVKDFTPATSPSFGTEAHRTLSESLGAMVTLAREGSLIALAVAPWLFVLALIGAPVYLIVRRFRTRPANTL